MIIFYKYNFDTKCYLRAFHDRIKDLVKVIKPIETTFYGATEFSVLDESGYVLTFAEDE